MAPRLNAAQRAAIDGEVDELFDELLTRLLGGAFTGRRLFIGYVHDLTLPGIFEAAVSEEGGRLDTEMVSGIAAVAQDFIDKYRAEAKAATKRRAQQLLHDVDQGRLKPEDFKTALQGELSELWGKVKTNVHAVVATETQHAQTMGVKDGIDQVNEGLGVEDPIVCFITAKDTNVCKECQRVHVLPDGKTPRVFKSSEVSTEYHVRGELMASWHLLHPHCRCALTTVLPGFGFDARGLVTWIHADHREWDYQRGFKLKPTPGVDARRKKLGLQKSEEEAFPRLEKMAVREILPGKEVEPGVWEYSHLLPQQHRGAFKLVVRRQGTEEYMGHEAQLHGSGGELVGHVRAVTAPMYRGELVVQESNLDGEHQGKGLGKAMYEALMAHAHHTLKLRFLSGGLHSTQAQPVHESLARKHKTGYQAGFDEEECMYEGYKHDLGKSEEDIGEPLLKYDVKYADLKRALEHYGWAVEREDGGHVIWNHPALPTPRPIPIKRNHASGAKPIDDEMLRQKYLKEAGLTIDRQAQIVPLARHPFAEHYRALGFEVPGAAEAKPETKTWEPSGYQGLQSVRIEHLIPTNNHESWQTAMHEAHFARGQGHKVPPVTAMDQGNGTWLVDQGHEQLEAARRAGMTHVPLKPV